MDLRNVVAVITGGASGLGKATADAFHAAGTAVALFDLNAALGTAAAQTLGERARFFRVDVTDEGSVQAALNATVAAFGSVHVCVNCAGTGNAIRTYGKKGPFPLAEFRKVIEVNLIGSFNVLRLAAEKMAANAPTETDGERGVIINTASVAAFEGQIGQAAYSASKGGVVGLTVPVARDLAAIGVRVNTIVPGMIDTPMFGGMEEDVKARLAADVVFPKRLGRPEEFARLARCIVETPYLNAETIRLDGGIRMQPK